MCRLMAYVGSPVCPAQVVYGGAHPLYEQSWASRELLSGTLNADGYGVAWYANGRPARIAEARPIWHDEGLRATLAAVTSSCVLAAVSGAGESGVSERALLAPLVHERWSFIMNGFVPRFRHAHMRALRAGLPDELYAELRGATDSETIFLLVLSHLRQGVGMVEALEAVARAVKERVGKEQAQLNLVLCDGERIAAVRCGTVLMTNSLYVARRPPFAPDGVVLASEAPEVGAVWEAVDGHSWLVIEPDGTTRSDLLFL